MRQPEINFFGLLAFSLCLLTVTSLPTNNTNYFKKETSDGVSIPTKRGITLNKHTMATLTTLPIYAMCNLPDKDIEKKGCKINVKTLHKNFPLILDPVDNTKFLYPDDDGKIYFDHGDSVFLSCSVGNEIRFVKLPNYDSRAFTCDCGKTFMDGENKHNLEDLTCTDYPHSAIVASNLVDEYQTYQIGFYTNANKDFLNLIDVFYDQMMSKMTMYVRSVVSQHKLGSQQTKQAVDFNPDNHYYPDIDSYYNEDSQIESFKLQLQTTNGAIAKEYLKKVSNDSKEGYIFNHSHMTPDSSMVYAAAGKATFAFLNAAPQFLGINGQNWAKIERHVIDIATNPDNKRDLVTITGIHEQLQLKAGDDTMVNMYLYAQKDPEVDENEVIENVIEGPKEPVVDDKLRIPIPKYMYKIVIDPMNNEGVVYVTVNNPYMKKEDSPRYELCETVYYRKDGVRNPMQWNPKSIKDGWSYMCEVYNFLTKTGILLPGTEADMTMNEATLRNMKLLALPSRDNKNKLGPSGVKPPKKIDL